MRMEASLQARQEMRMRLAPQVIQSIEILQLPLIELKHRIDEELQENPMLEQTISEDKEEDAKTKSLENSEVEEPAEEEKLDEVSANEEEQADDFDRFDELASYYERSASATSSGSYSPNTKGDKQEAFENSPAPDPSLEDHLNSQLAYHDLDEDMRAIGENIVANLDDRGYLAHPLEEIVASMDNNVTLEQAEDALKLVQSFEPPGVAARNTEECLLLQLDKRDPNYDLLKKIITNHFDDILQNRYPKVARAAGCSIEKLKEAVESISKLNPIPGSLFQKPITPHVTPEIRIVERDGKFEVIQEDSWLPSLSICAYYARRLRQKDLDEKTREYLKKKLQSAQGLISAIEQRRATVQNVTEDIVNAQKEFFEKGEMHLKPLKMQEVADRVGVHVSTVSRAISDKYAQTPQGIYSLKHFFTGGVEKDNGEMESWEVVKKKLLNIVENEDKSNPLSDQDIADKLNEEGIDIARRTISKYRKNLNIPSSRMRKEY
ncbi:MAG: RNA polymerase factor sigma-54 [Planctomycetes bacterium]|nr:RNA polymerase factor sigma-54 [Planctomycetota bacterium]